jgi:hypothetical protein
VKPRPVVATMSPGQCLEARPQRVGAHRRAPGPRGHPRFRRLGPLPHMAGFPAAPVELWLHTSRLVGRSDLATCRRLLALTAPSVEQNSASSDESRSDDDLEPATEPGYTRRFDVPRTAPLRRPHQPDDRAHPLYNFCSGVPQSQTRDWPPNRVPRRRISTDNRIGARALPLRNAARGGQVLHAGPCSTAAGRTVRFTARWPDR